MFLSSSRTFVSDDGKVISFLPLLIDDSWSIWIGGGTIFVVVLLYLP